MPAKPKPLPELVPYSLYPLHEACGLLRVTYGGLRDLIGQGLLETVEVMNSTRVLGSSMLRLTRATELPAAAPITETRTVAEIHRDVRATFV